MKSYALPLLVIAGLTFGLAAVSVTTPEWTKKAGLDFWNFDTEKDRLGVADLEGRHLNAIRERQAERIAVSDYLASDLCEKRITLDESLDILTGVAHDDPDWFATFRDGYCLHGYLPQAVADRDVLACYLRITIAG